MASSTLKKISILGTGNMGRALGVRFAALGHAVFFAGRDPAAAPSRAAARAGDNARAGTLDEAAAFGDILVWTIRARDPKDVFSSPQAAVEQLEGKIIIDLNNRDYAGEVVGDQGQGRWFDRSLGEELQGHLPKANVVKAFNTVAMEALDTGAAALRQSSAQVFVAGGDDGAREVVSGLVSDLGFESVDLGPGKVAMKVAEALGDAVRYLMIDRHMGGRANIGVRMLPKPDLDLIGDREASQYH